MNPNVVDGTKRFPCAQCGAQLLFKPGADSLVCHYCGHVNVIDAGVEAIEELDFLGWLEVARSEAEADHEQTVKCNACAAQFTLSGLATANKCPFCGSATIVPAPVEVRIRPQSVLPFKVDDKQGKEIYRKWISSRFWAPNALKDFARNDSKLNGMYLPHWTFDTNTESDYSGMRGEYYYETESYTDYENGQAVRKTRQVRKTRWYPASGTVFVDFDDVLVPGSATLPMNHVRAVGNYDLQNLVPFKDDYLSGFSAERYSIGLEPAFHDAQGIMAQRIDSAVRSDIGGDEQQVHNIDTDWNNITFKHLLTPLWMGAYQYQGKTFRFLINGRTGQISGDAPISAWKVAAAILLGLIVLAIIIAISNQ